MKKILLALAGGVMAIGMAIGTSVPAQAVTVTKSSSCPWGQKSTFKVTNNNTGYARLEAYSPTGYHLGTFSSSWVNFTWATPWEDVTVWGYSSDSTWQIGSYCRL